MFKITSLNLENLQNEIKNVILNELGLECIMSNCTANKKTVIMVFDGAAKYKKEILDILGKHKNSIISDFYFEGYSKLIIEIKN